MHIIALFGIIILIFLRACGLVISIEFLHDLKESKFKILIIGWITWILAGIFALLISISEIQLLTDIFSLINGVTGSIAILFVMMGLYSYFQKISRRLLLLSSIILAFIPLTAFLLGFFSLANNLTSMSLFLISLIYTYLPLRKVGVFKKELSIKSMYWYLTLAVIVYTFVILYVIFIFQGYSFGFYSDEFSIPMFFNYFFGCLITVVILIYYIHLEYDISKVQKYKLRDKYSHDLGNLVQVIYSAAILTNVKEDLNNEKVENLDLIQEKCEEAAKLIKDIKETK